MAILAADIGGTNARFALIDEKTLKILVKETLETKRIKNLNAAIKKFLEKHGKRVTRGAFSVAGPVTERNGKRSIEGTNADYIVREKELLKLFKKVTLLNDFEALAYALDIKGMTKTLRKRKSGGTRILVGPGTGLGHSIITPKGEVLRCEGDHATTPLVTTDDYALATFIKASRKQPQEMPLIIEHILSGRGLEYIYEFLRYTKHAKNPHLPKRLTAEEIGMSKTKNRCSKDAMKLFVRFLARRCQDFALDTYATGGLFLAGGILQKNPEIIDESFLKAFSRQQDAQYREILERIPIILITHEDAGLLGAAAALKRRF